MFHRGEIDERLERRARLALGGTRPVELALAIVAAADEGANGARLIERHQGALRDAELLALLVELVFQRLLGQALQAFVEGRRHDDVLLYRADLVGKRVHHIIGCVIDRAGAAVASDLGGLRQRRLLLGRRDEALLEHGVEDLPGALLRALGIAVRRELARSLHQAGEHGRLGKRDLARAVAVVAARRRLDAIRAGTEIDAVEIKLEDLILAVFALEPERQDRLLNLARERALLGEEEILGELLGERGAALHAPSPDHIAQKRARKALGVEAPMRIEAAVLDRDEGLR